MKGQGLASQDRDSLPVFSQHGEWHGEWIDTPLARHLTRMTISPAHPGWLSDQLVAGSVVLPPSMQLALLLARTDGRAISQLCFALPCPIARNGTDVQIVAGHDDRLAIYAKSPGAKSPGANPPDGWECHASASIVAAEERPEAWDIPSLRERLREDAGGPVQLPARLADFGLLLGPAYRRITRLWRGTAVQTEILAEIRNPASEGWPVHPASLDACLQGLLAALCPPALIPDRANSRYPAVTGIDRACLWEVPTGAFFCHVRKLRLGAGEVAGDITLLATDGRVLARLEGVTARLLPCQTERTAGPPEPALWTRLWQRNPLLADNLADAAAHETIGAALYALGHGMTRRLSVLDLYGPDADRAAAASLLQDHWGPLIARFDCVPAADPDSSISGPAHDLVMLRGVGPDHLVGARAQLAPGGVAILMDCPAISEDDLTDAGLARQATQIPDTALAIRQSPRTASDGAPLLLVHSDEASEDDDSHRLATSLAGALTGRGFIARPVSTEEALSWLRGSAPLAGLVHLASLDLDERDSAPALSDWHSLIRVSLTRAELPPLWLVTRGAQTGGAAVGASALWGLGQIARLEHPDLMIRMIDLDPASPDTGQLQDSAEPLLAELTMDDDTAATAGASVIWRDGQRLVPCLQPCALSDSLNSGDADDGTGAVDGTALVTGGFTASGLALVDWLLVTRRASHVVLTGHDAPPPELEDRGFAGPVRLRQLDVTDEAAVGELLAEIDDSLPGLTALYHLPDSSWKLPASAPVHLLSQDWERFRAVFHPRVTAAHILDRLTRDRPLGDFVLLADPDGLQPDHGRAAHAAANASTAALIEARRRAGLPGLLLEWDNRSEMADRLPAFTDVLATALSQDRHSYLGWLPDR